MLYTRSIKKYVRKYQSKTRMISYRFSNTLEMILVCTSIIVYRPIMMYTPFNNY